MKAVFDPEQSARASHHAGAWGITFRILLQAYGRSLMSYCRHLLRDEELAKDVYQTVLMQAFEDLPSFTGRSSFRIWLQAIARYRCIDTLKVARSRSRYVVRQEAVPDMPDPQSVTEEQVAAAQTLAVLRAQLRRLPPKARQVLELRFCEQLSYEEMARRCGERAVTLRVRVARALPLLRRLMEEAGFTS